MEKSLREETKKVAVLKEEYGKLKTDVIAAKESHGEGLICMHGKYFNYIYFIREISNGFPYLNNVIQIRWTFFRSYSIQKNKTELKNYLVCMHIDQSELPQCTCSYFIKSVTHVLC